MGILSWVRRRLGGERRELTLEKFGSLGLLDSPTAAGVIVTEKTALTLASYWCGVNLIASAIGKLPRKVYRKLADDSREEAPDHAVAWIVQNEPNPFVVPITFWRTLIGHVLTWGNGYAEIERDRAMRPIALWTIAPNRLEPVITEKGLLAYRYNGGVLISREDIFHVPGLGFDGLKGYSVVQMAKQSLGVGLAAEMYGAAFFGQGAWPGVLLEHPNELGEEAEKRLKASWEALHKGPDRAHRTAILEEGLKAHVLTVPAKDAQLIETRELQVLEVARWLNINPALLGYKTAERPGGNYESSRLDFLDNTLDPWLVAIEQECNRKLISSSQRGTYYVEHVRNAVLRTDAKTRADVQKVYVDMGAMSPEHVAKQENLPPPDERELPLADKVEAVGQLIRAGFDPEASAKALGLPAIPHTGRPPVTVQAEPDPPPDDEPAPDASRSLAALALTTVARFTRREAAAARKAAKRGPEQLELWTREFYQDAPLELASMLEPIVELRAALLRVKADARPLAQRLAGEYTERSRQELLDLPAQNLAVQTDLLMRSWETVRPAEIAGEIMKEGSYAG